MAVNPTTGLYDLTGGDTSAVATTGINNNFTQLYNRVRNSYIIEEGTSGDWHYRVHYVITQVYKYQSQIFIE